jgi:hypothetical protein
MLLEFAGPTFFFNPSPRNKDMPQVHAKNPAQGRKQPHAGDADTPRRFPLLPSSRTNSGATVVCVTLDVGRLPARQLTRLATLRTKEEMEMLETFARNATSPVAGTLVYNVVCGRMHGSPSRRVQKRFLEGLVAFDSWDPVGRTSKCLMHACRTQYSRR